jgi:hypothetical protein
MDPRKFAYYLMRHPEVADAVMALVDAEATFEEDSKHLPYTESGGSTKSHETAERITELARLLVANDSTPPAARRAPEDPGMVVLKLADGWELHSGLYDPDSTEFTCGEWVSLHRPDGSEYVYWDASEWQTDPELVMGAIINSAAGYRPADADSPGSPDDTVRRPELRRTRPARADELRILQDVAELVAGGHPDDFPEGSVDALDHAIVAFGRLSPELLSALRAVVDYDWSTEERDYTATVPAEREGHVFAHLQRLDELLRAFSR